MIGKIVISISVIFSIAIIVIIGEFLEFIPASSWGRTFKIILIFMIVLIIILLLLFFIVKTFS